MPEIRSVYKFDLEFLVSFSCRIMEDRISRLALISRLSTLILGCLASNVIARPYDTSSDFALRRASLASLSTTDSHLNSFPTPNHSRPGDSLIDFLFSSFVRWDAVYFLDIAETRGYRNEQNAAFLPGLPLLVSLLASGERLEG